MVINSWNYDDADHLEFPLKQTRSEILSFQQAQDILIDIYYNCYICKLVFSFLLFSSIT